MTVRSAILALALFVSSISLYAADVADGPAAADPAAAHERRLDAVLLHLPLPEAVLDGATHTITVELRDRDHVVVRPERHRVEAQTSAGAAIRLELQGVTRAALLLTPEEMHERLRFLVSVDGIVVAAHTVRDMLAHDDLARGLKEVQSDAGRVRSPREYETDANRIVNNYKYPFTCPGTACSTQYSECSTVCNPGGRPRVQVINNEDPCQQECDGAYQLCRAGQRLARRTVETKLPDVRVVANECICDPVSYILTLGLNCFKYDSYFRVSHFQVFEDRYCSATGQYYYNVLVEEWDETQFCYHKQKNSDGSWSGCQYGEILFGKCNISAPR